MPDEADVSGDYHGAVGVSFNDHILALYSEFFEDSSGRLIQLLFLLFPEYQFFSEYFGYFHDQVVRLQLCGFDVKVFEIGKRRTVGDQQLWSFNGTVVVAYLPTRSKLSLLFFELSYIGLLRVV